MTSSLGTAAKKALEEFVPVIDAKLSGYFDTEIAKNFGFNDRQKIVARDALVHSKEHNLRASKRIRGSFVNYGFKLSGKPINDLVWNASMGVELIHTALLMHDDIEDRDEMRRGGPTTHKFYEAKFKNTHLGVGMGINVGDTILCMGFEKLMECNNISVMNQMLRSITNTAHGQSYDITLEGLGNWTEEDVIVLHKAKTAIYTYENPLIIGAMLAGLNSDTFTLLHDYAMDGGVAFQLQDDILGVFGTPEKTGKSADSDLKQGKCTLLVLKAFDRPEVKKVWGDMNASRSDLDAAKKAIIDSGSYQYNKDLAANYARKAAATANKLRDLNLDLDSIDYIQGIAEYMVEREV